MKKVLFSGLVFLMAYSLRSNNVRVSNVQRLESDKTKIQFTVSWDNSWAVGGAPGNHDAVWVFVKYRPCGAGGTWTHGLLDTNMANHTISPLLVAAKPVSLRNRLGNIPTGATLTNGKGHNTGIMLRRATYGVGHIVNATSVIKLVNTDFDPNTDYDIRVFAIEMVQVVQEGFMTGDGSPNSNNAYNLVSKAFNQITIGSENAISANALYTGSPALPAEYPKGFAEFYCMKYEITQGQYYQYGATGGVGGPGSHPVNRNNYHDQTTPDRAQNFMNWDDLIGYLDWAALRPMTELEYEKACKGPLSPVMGGYAWGSTTIVRALYVSGTEDGTETVATVNANAHYYDLFPTFFRGNTSAYPPDYKNATYNSTSGDTYDFSSITTPACTLQTPVYPTKYSNYYQYRCYAPVLMCGSDQSQGYGPLGVGIFARDNTLTRITTGATYYGIMEMSGNVAEQCVNVKSTSYTGEWGDGYLGSTGKANVVGWPGGENSYTDRAVRGGGYGCKKERLVVADRFFAECATQNRTFSDANSTEYGTGQEHRQGTVGGRGVR